MVEIEEIVEDCPAASAPQVELPPQAEPFAAGCAEDVGEGEDDEFFDALSELGDPDEPDSAPETEPRTTEVAHDGMAALDPAKESPVESLGHGGDAVSVGTTTEAEEEDTKSEGFVIVDQGDLAGSEGHQSSSMLSEAAGSDSSPSGDPCDTEGQGEANLAEPAGGAPQDSASALPTKGTTAETAEALQQGGVPAESDQLLYTDAEKEEMIKAADVFKAEGNRLFGQAKFGEAAEQYTEAVAAGPSGAPELAVYYANRAACMLKLDQYQSAVDDCTEALTLQPGYVKALMRRGLAAEKLDDVETALADAKKVVDVEPGNQEALRTVRRLEPIVAEKREKLKEEMMGKLKDLGNSVLGKFGMSLDNFQAVQDPETGGYSINFKS